MARLPTRFAETALERIGTAQQALRNWRREARDAYAFVAGRQWSAEDEAKLREQRRPTVTFNYSEKMIDAVVGAEVSNRHEVRYSPREMSDDGTAELLTQAAHWVRDQCDAEDNDTDAFRDMLICGLGWTVTRMNYDRDPDGLPEIQRGDPLEFFYDPAAIRKGLADRRYDFRQWWVDEVDASAAWPGQILTTGPHEAGSPAGGTVIRRGDRYNAASGDEYAESDEDLHADQVLITHYECVEREPFYRVADGNNIYSLTQAEFAKLRDALDRLGIQYVKQTRLVYYHAYFAGETLLEADLSPCQDGFLFNVITGKRDRNRNIWYGLVRIMKDPQCWANKWLSQIMHIINTNAKGGLLAETGAFVDPRKAEDEWASPDSITLLNEGGINKVQPKASPPYPSGLDRLMEFALSSLPQVTGINLEALGLANREQAGVLEQQRKEAAYGLLAPLFDSLRLYRKQQGRVLLYFIRHYISDGRLIRVSGKGAASFAPLTRVPDLATYDIIVDQSPNAPDVKQKTWETLVQILPALLKAGIPVSPSLLDYTPLPTSLSMEWKQYIEQSQGNMDPAQMQQLQQQFQQLQQENMRLTQQVRDKSADLQLKQQEAAAELELKRAELEAQLQLKRLEIAAEIDLQRTRVEGDHNLAAAKLGSDIQLRTAAEANQTGAADAASATQLVTELDMELSNAMNALAAALAQIAQSQQAVAQAVDNLQQAVSSPKVARMPDGRTIVVSPTGAVQQ